MENDLPIWSRVLLQFYEKNMLGENFDKYGYHRILRQKAVAESLEEDESEVYNAISGLEDLGLIVEPPSGRESQGFRLTRDGFEVAHEIDRRRRAEEREKRQDERQHEINRAIGLLTLGLVVVGLIQAIISGMIGTNSPLWEINAMITAGSVITVGIVFLLYREGLLIK